MKKAKQPKIFINNIEATILDLVTLFDFIEQRKIKITAVHKVKSGDTKIFYKG